MKHPDPKVMAAAAACVQSFRQREPGPWTATAIQSAEGTAAGGLSLKLVLCSGDMCRMEVFVATESEGEWRVEASAAPSLF